MAPTHEQVVADCNDMRSDATKWQTASDAMHGAASTARGLTLGDTQFGLADAAQGCKTAYATIQDKMAGLLDGADAEFEKVAKVLKASADTYEKEDAAGAHRFDSMGGN
jgi:hypothetical protein